MYSRHQKQLDLDSENSNHIWANIMINAMYKNAYFHFKSKLSHGEQTKEEKLYTLRQFNLFKQKLQLSSKHLDELSEDQDSSMISERPQSNRLNQSPRTTTLKRTH